MSHFFKYSYTFLSCLLFPFLSFSQCEVILTDTFVCHFGNSITLSPQVTGSSITSTYRIDEIPYAFIEHSNSNFLDLQDDDVSQAIDLGFDFEFYGNVFNQIYVGSNGWISFSPNQSINYLSTSIPSADFSVPKNAIFAAWEDWNPIIGGTISYALLENGDSSMFVVSYESLSHYLCDSELATQGSFQIILNQADNSIITNITNKSSCLSVSSLQGIINEDGINALSVEGRNSSVWSAELHSIKYTPSNNIYFNWLINNDVVHENDSLCISPYSSQDVSLLYWDDIGCDVQLNFSVEVLPEYENNIVRVGDVLYSSLVDDSYSYQWYFDGVELEGETNSSLNLLSEGQYFVQILNTENGCYYNSRIHLYVTASINENNKHFIQTYPQPSNGIFSINTSDKISLIKIYDSKGILVKEIRSVENNKFKTSLNSGIYFAHFYIRDKKYYSRLVISN